MALALSLSSSALSSSPPQGPPPPTEIQVDAKDDGRRIQLKQDEILVITLESNPSTGYTWELEEAEVQVESQGILQQVGKTEFTPQTSSPEAATRQDAPYLLGAPGTQILRFAAVETGQTTLSLVYRRPWERDVSPARTYSLQVEGVGPFTSVETVARVDANDAAPESPVLEQSQPSLGLPSSLNWCDQGGCTPVKDQGGCGSCWAFSTVGPLESNILLQDGLTRDLSEQYLLSCNADGWDCTGGSFAHDYHWWEFVQGEPDAGAVYESDFSYLASKVSCDPPHPHYEKLVSWHYVQDSPGVPPIADIKQAIYDYGPVSAAVCASPSFRDYTTGVFETDETQWCLNSYGQPVNHAVVLVGWDDNQGANGVWILRNSWGPDWGEGGYIRIGYGVNSVGWAANYVVYEPDCHELTTNASPDGTGSVSADPAPNCGVDEYEPGTEVQLTANASTGWDFTAWSGDAFGSSETITVTLDADKSVTAHFMCDGCLPLDISPLVMKNYAGKPSGWITILSEDFEGAFPGQWSVFDNQTGFGEYYWGKRNCRSSAGDFSGWAVGAGGDGASLTCGADYPHQNQSWMMYGPFSLGDATAADLQFKMWLNTQTGYDWMCRGASIDGSNFYVYCASGYSSGWMDISLDLSTVHTIGSLLGQPQVWIALIFDSDENQEYAEGAYVDDIVLRKHVSGSGSTPPAATTLHAPPTDAQIQEVPVIMVRPK